MAKNEIKTQSAAPQEEVAESVSKAGQWVIENQNLLSWIVCGLAVVILGVMAINTYVINPKRVEASNENAKAAFYFMAGDYAKALNGDDAECIGFEAIANEYSFYQQGKLAALYAGICYYEQGDYEQAAKFLSKFSADDEIIDPAASLHLGDAYVELGELDKAAKAFKNAAKGDVIAPIALQKLAIVYLELGKNDAAKKALEQIKSDYPASQQALDADKYIAICK